MLKRVKIKGYKSLVDVEVDFQPLVVLFGPNGAGKSNLLDAFQLLSRIVVSGNLQTAFDPPYRGAPLESFNFGRQGIKGLIRRKSVSFTIEVHPRRIGLVAEYLKTQSTHGRSQAIVTTHSPVFTDFIPDESLYVCQKEEGRTTIYPYTSWGPLSRRKDPSKVLGDKKDRIKMKVSDGC